MCHVPVLKDEIIELLSLKEGGVYVDCTAGRGGHIQAIIENSPGFVKIYGIDKDRENVDYLNSVYRSEDITIINSDYRDLDRIFSFVELESADGFIFDLGFSSVHVDQAQRGFSFRRDGPLDMRYDRSQELSAEYVVNAYPRDDLIRIFREYGEERYARKIADNILSARKKERITGTFRLRELICSSIPVKNRNLMKIDPATRVFQAIRIEVNSELDSLSIGLEKAVRLCRKGGRICVISFHSLEDRIVKKIFNRYLNPCTCPPKLPECICNKKPEIRLINKKPIIPGYKEMQKNARARSAKLRVAEKE
jgi:16S rRNA (cytosine1402-N4)-methyltransferase